MSCLAALPFGEAVPEVGKLESDWFIMSYPRSISR